MPYVGRGVEPPRKRRWQEDEDGTIFKLYRSEDEDTYQPVGHHRHYSPRKILPISKRARISDHGGYETDLLPTHCRRGKHTQHNFGLDSRPSDIQKHNPLQPCHVCHRRPTKKSDLDSFANCQGCDERTCFVCLRECHGRDADRAGSVLSEQEALSRSFHMDDADEEPSTSADCHGRVEDSPRNLDGREAGQTANTTNKDTGGWIACGHRSVVCSRCCVERGVEGEVVCLGCLSGIDFR